MSRGLGRLQNLIVEAVQHGHRQFNELCWSLAEISGSGAAEGLPRAYYVSFQRAVSHLEDRRLVNVDRRKLVSLGELIAYYPHRPRQRALREMRSRLLPLIQKYLER